MAPDVGMTTGVCTRWEEALLLDYTIDVEDEQFKVHKVIMASVSDYFKAMLTGGMVESQTDRVRLEGLDPVAVSNMIEYIYTGQFGTKTATTEDLLGCAVYFQFPAAIEKCTDLLCKEINDDNCLDIFTIFSQYCLEDAAEHTLKYIKSNINNILKAFKPNTLPYTTFQAVMDIWVKSEWDLFDSVNLWISADFENRVKHLNDLMSRIRFALMSPEELAAVQESFTFTTFNGPWCDLVCQAIEYHNLPTHQKVVNVSEQSTVRVDPAPVCFSLEYDDEMKSDRLVGEYCAGKSWTRHKALKTPPDFQFPVIAVQVNNFLIMCDSSQVDKRWHIFDPRTGKWSTMGQLVVSREAFALVHHEGHLYVLGGLIGGTWTGMAVDSIERYDFDMDKWCQISSEMPYPLYHHGACSAGNLIYVTGGSEKLYKSEQLSEQLYCFDPLTETWETKCPMPRGTSKCKALTMNLWGEDVVFVISDNFTMQYYTPSTNQWSIYNWRQHLNQTKLSWTLGGTILGEGNTFVFLNFDSARYTWDKCSRLLVCAKWIVEEKGKKVIEVPLNNFPLLNDEENVGKECFSALISFLPDAVKAEQVSYDLVEEEYVF